MVAQIEQKFLTSIGTTTVRHVPSWMGDLFLPLRRCRQRILLVTDGLNYNPADDFGLSRFVDELNKISPAPIITKANRFGDPTADRQNFVFDNTVTTANFDQVWLFGISSAPVLSDAQLQVLTNFMVAGGGVFATGDHETLGFAMCGELYRVRKMRDWSGIPMFNNRIDTVTNPGPDNLAQFHDQSDEYPQRIFPHYYGSGSSWSPHPLLRSPMGDIDVMPDHPHESVCLVGPNLAANYNMHGINRVEFPAFNGTPLAPEVIATSVSAGRFLTDIQKPPTTPRCFGSISVWDGHKVNQGRIVCDSTWHHFVNINLDGTGAPPQPPNNRRGLRDAALNFTPEFHKIAEYYRNIADWIIPQGRRWCRWWLDFVVERYRFPLFEEWRPLPPHPCPWELRVRLGIQVEGALKANRGRGFAEEVVTAAIESARVEEFASLIRPTRAEFDAGSLGQRNLISPDELRYGILGSVFDAFARELPENPGDLPKFIEKRGHDDQELLRTAVGAASSAVEAALEHYAEGAKRTFSFLARAAGERLREKVINVFDTMRGVPELSRLGASLAKGGPASGKSGASRKSGASKKAGAARKAGAKKRGK